MNTTLIDKDIPVMIPDMAALVGPEFEKQPVVNDVIQNKADSIDYPNPGDIREENDIIPNISGKAIGDNRGKDELVKNSAVNMIGGRNYDNWTKQNIGNGRKTNNSI